MAATPRANVTAVVVATTVMLSFISFWRAAAIVLSDLASSAYYVGGIAETAIGKAAPWFILAIMLFSYAVRAVYIESCSMFVRGGVYRVVHEAMGGTLAKISVSALMFDYVLTGPISGGSGLADSFYQPFVLGWNKKRIAVRTTYGFLAPTGSYKLGANDNVGSGYWTHIVSSGQTFFLTKNKATTLSTFQRR